MATIPGGIFDLSSGHSPATLDVIGRFLDDVNLTPGIPSQGIEIDGGGFMWRGIGDQDVSKAVIAFPSDRAPGQTSVVDLLGITSIPGGDGARIELGVGADSLVTVITPSTSDTVVGAAGFLNQLVDSVVDTSQPGGAELSASLKDAIDVVSGGDTSAQLVHVVQVINDQQGLPSNAPITITASGLGSGIAGATVALNLNQTYQPVVVDGLASVLIVGSGHVSVGGSTNTILAGDFRNQTIIGGAGNDTIFGGLGHDTIIGGSGRDRFLLNGTGNDTIVGVGSSNGDTSVYVHNPVTGELAIHSVTIGDFTDDDVLHFMNYSDLDELKANLDYLGEINGNTIAHFKDGTAIFLIGVQIDQLHADLFDFG